MEGGGKTKKEQKKEKKMKNPFKTYKPKPKKSKHKNPWAELSEEMTKWFGKNCFWIPYKFPDWKIRNAFAELKRDGDYDLTHLLAKLNKAKKMNKEKIAQMILDAYYEGDKKRAFKLLKMFKGILGDKAFKFLKDKLSEDIIDQAQLVIGGKIIKE